jgi:hypothetical protein
MSNLSVNLASFYEQVKTSTDKIYPVITTIENQRQYEQAMEIAREIKADFSRVEKLRKAYTKMLDDAKRDMMQPEKVLQSKLNEASKPINDWATLQANITQFDKAVSQLIAEYKSKTINFFDQAAKDGKLAQVRNIKIDKVKFSEEQYKSFVNRFTIPEKHLTVTFSQLYSSLVSACNDAKNSINFQELESIHQAKEAIQVEQVVRQSVAESESLTPAYTRASYEPVVLGQVDYIALINFCLENGISEKYFEPFLKYAAAKGCPEIKGIEYKQVVKTQIR